MRKHDPESFVFPALLLFSFSIIFSVTVLQGSILLAFFLWLTQHGRAAPFALKNTLVPEPLFRPWMVYLAVCLLTSLTAYYPLTGLGQFKSDLLKYTVYATLLLAIKKDQLPRLSVAYTAAAMTAALIGIGEVLHFFPANNIDPTRADAFMNAVRYGEVMGLALLLALSRLAIPAREAFRHEHKFYLAAAALTFTALVMSKTRGAYLGVFAGTLVILFMSGMSRKKALAILASMTALIVFSVKTVPGVAERFVAARKLVIELYNPSKAEYSRIKMWKVGLKMFEAHPLTGVGPDNVRKVFADFCPELIAGRSWSSLHDIYLHQAAERGILGLGALLYLFSAMLGAARRNFKKEKSPYTLWALCALPAFFLMNLTETSFQNSHPSAAIFLALALSSASAWKED